MLLGSPPFSGGSAVMLVYFLLSFSSSWLILLTDSIVLGVQLRASSHKSEICETSFTYSSSLIGIEVIGSIFFIFDIGVISCVKERFYFVCIGQVNDLCPIFGVSSGYLRDKCRYSLLQTKTAIPSINGITVLDRNMCKILLINHTLRDDAMDIYSVICY